MNHECILRVLPSRKCAEDGIEVALLNPEPVFQGLNHLPVGMRVFQVNEIEIVKKNKEMEIQAKREASEAQKRPEFIEYELRTLL